MRKLLASAIKSGAGSAATLCFGVITNKVLAIIAGPAGVGLFSLLRQAHQVFTLLGSMNGYTAIVQGIASRRGRDRHTYSFTAFTIQCSLGLIVAALVAIAAPWLAEPLLDQTGTDGTYLLYGLSAAALLAVLLSYLQGVLGAHRAVGPLAALQAVTAAVMAILAFPAAAAMARGQPVFLVLPIVVAVAVTGLLAFLYARWKGQLPSATPGTARFSTSAARHFLSIAVASLVTSVAFSGSILTTRTSILNTMGLAAAGVFDAAWTIGMTYISLLFSTFISYYLPTLSGTDGLEARRGLVEQALRFALLTAVPLLLVAIVAKLVLITLLYSTEFAESAAVLRWVLIADFFVATNWVFGMTIIAYADVRSAVWSGLLWPLGFVALVIASVGHYGSLPAVGASYLLAQFGYFAFLLRYVTKRGYFKIRSEIAAKWFAGLCLIVLASWHMWAASSFAWSAVLIWLVPTIAFPWFVLNARQRQKLLALLTLRHV